jgi:hypothetical protein
MSHTFSIYGLGVLANTVIPGASPASISSVDVRLFFGKLPDWVDAVDSSEMKPWYTSRYKDESGIPSLKVVRLRGKYFWFSYTDQTQFIVDQEGTNIWAVWPRTLTIEDTATYLLGPIMGFVLLLRGGVSLHASAIAIDDQVIALVGPAGAGKSTTAAAFADLGYSILAEDVVTLDDLGDRFMVQPAYPCIRLWPSSVKALYGQEAELPRLTPNWDKCYLDLTQEQYDFKKEPLPLAAIYLLDNRSEDPTAPSVHEVPSNEALISLIANTYATYLMDKKMRAREFELLGRVLKNVPVRRVVPHVDPVNIPSLCKTILADFDAINPKTPPSGTQEHALHV